MLLDTNLVSFYISPRARERYPVTIDLIDSGLRMGELHVAYVTVYELRRGLAKLGYHSADDRRREARKKRVRLDKLFMVMTPLGLDPDGWNMAAELWARGQLKKPAINFSEPDLLIAATALYHGVALATAETKPAMVAGLAELAPELVVVRVHEREV